MLGSLDCYAWKWDKCPKAWQGQYKGHKGTSVILEAAVSYDLWFWHAFFGMPGTLNDINVLQRSPLFDEIVNGTGSKTEYMINGNTYNHYYWLVDGIYPS